MLLRCHYHALNERRAHLFVLNANRLLSFLAKSSYVFTFTAYLANEARSHASDIASGLYKVAVSRD